MQPIVTGGYCGLGQGIRPVDQVVVVDAGRQQPGVGATLGPVSTGLLMEWLDLSGETMEETDALLPNQDAEDNVEADASYGDSGKATSC